MARAIVVGGSPGGLFVANLLLREGWDVQVYERAAEPLVGRGAGIAKAAIDAMTLIDHIGRTGRTGGHVTAALEHDSRNRVKINAAIVEHARELGNYLQSLTQPAKRRRPPRRTTRPAVLREIAVPYESLNLA